MLNLNNTLDGYLKNVEVIGNTVQDTNNLADIRSVGDKVEGQELYKIDVVSCGKNLFDVFEHEDLLSNYDYTISMYKCKYLKLSPNTTYTVSISASNDVGLLLINSNKEIFKDGYLDFRAQIGDKKTYRTDDTGLLYIGTSITDNDLVKKLLKRNIQIEEGTQVTPYEPYKENKLEILSPTQLEKVGDVADRIIYKDGVWGVEKSIKTTDLKDYTFGVYNSPIEGTVCVYNKMSDIKPSTPVLCNALVYNLDIMTTYGNFIRERKDSNVDYGVVIRITNSILNGDNTVKGVTEWLGTNNVKLKYVTSQPQFIPLPHDQQVKLRTFAGQTNIAFLTEIPGQIKAQVPKSLGATVNTHTEQIAELHNSLDRVKKLEETTVSTIETGSGFTTVDATSNGYFEDVKLEGKTLVNLCKDANNKVNLIQTTTTHSNQDYSLLKCDLNTKYYVILKDLVMSNDSNIFNHIHIGFLDTDWITKVDVKAGRNGVFTLNLADKLPRKLRVQLTKGDVGYTFSYNGIILIPSKDISYEQALELACFEGLMSVGQDVEEVSVESMTDNLLDICNTEMKLISSSENIPTNARILTDNEIYYKGKYGVFFNVYLPKGTFNIGCSKEVIGGGSSNVNIRVYQIGDWSKALAQGTNTVQFTSKGDKYNVCFYGSMGNDIECKLYNLYINVCNINYIKHQSNKKPLLYYNPTTETWEKPILREWDSIEKHSDGKYYYHKRSKEVVLNGSESWSGLNTSSELFNRMYISLPGKAYGVDNFVADNFIFKTDNVANISGGGFAWGNINNDTLWFTFSKTLDSKSKWIDHLQANPTTLVYQLAQEEVYECTNIDLMTYSGETNYIINSGAISPKSLLKLHNNISNVVKILQEKVSLLENTFIAGLKSVLSGDMYSLATILYPEDFEQNDNTEQDIMVIPE